jgi:transposase-like protein
VDRELVDKIDARARELGKKNSQTPIESLQKVCRHPLKSAGGGWLRRGFQTPRRFSDTYYNQATRPQTLMARELSRLRRCCPSSGERFLTFNSITNRGADRTKNMKKISDERKEAILAKRSGPDRKPMATIAAEEGLSTATLYNWRKRAREEGRLLPDHDDNPEGWSSRDKFNAVLETAALSEAELSEKIRGHP